MQREHIGRLDTTSTDIPAEMRALPHWLVWKLERRHGKPSKVPYSVHGGYAKTNAPETWGSYDEAMQAVQSGRYNGVGFVFEGTPFVGVDLDHVINPATGEMHPEAARIVQELASYTERSQSGTGLHIIVRGQCPGPPTDAGERRRCKSRKGSPIDVEIYGNGSPRYFAMTGDAQGADHRLEDVSIREAQAELEAVYSRFMAPPEKAKKALPEDRLIKKIRSSRSAAQFDKLWAGDTSDYGGDESRADMALCNMLAFWTGRDHARMDELFRQSGLMRPKWDEKRGTHTYGDLTILEAIEKCVNVYKGRGAASHSAPPADGRPPVDAGTEYYIDEVDGCWHCAPPGKVPFRMCNFTAEITRELLRDDGMEQLRELVIAGKHAQGFPLQALTVTAQQFSAMNFVIEGWGAKAVIEPGQGMKDRIRHAIQLSSENVQGETVYTHTGFRMVGGRLCYLYHGGAVGGEGYSVELPEQLRHYVMPQSWKMEDLQASLSLLDMFDHSISVPLLAFMYLAPLREFMRTKPNFTLFLRGGTNTGKSTLAALFMSHFGSFDKARFPANYADTANAIRQKAFIVKDAPLWVDDYHPTNDPITKRRMDDVAQAIARAYGDNATRGRMTSDSRMQEARPVRGLCLSTGEDTPKVQDSGLARFFVIPLEHGDVPISAGHPQGEAFSTLQRSSVQLGGAMRAYIEWLIPQAETLPDRLEDAMFRHRKEAQRHLTGSYARQSESVAHLMVGFETMMRFLEESGVLSETEAAQLLADAPYYLWHLVENQTKEMQAERPENLFMDALRALIASGEITVRHLTHNPGTSIGYKDEDNAYFNYSAAFNAIKKFYRDQGDAFPISSKNMMTKHLKDAGISPDTTYKKYINGQQGRWLVIPLHILEGANRK